jgi:hypothetical protein
MSSVLAVIEAATLPATVQAEMDAAHAERAAAFLHGLQPKAEPAAEPDADDYGAAA